MRTDAPLRAEIEALLAAYDAPTTFLDRSPNRLLGQALEPGTVLCDRFLILRLLGLGGMGAVWAAMDRHLSEAVAIKIIHPLITEDPVVLGRFKRELQLARRIAHPNVCRVHEIFEDVGSGAPRFFLTMELLEGETLAARLSREGRISRDEALTLIQQVIAGLLAAHAAGVMHRDLKPANIMLTPSPTRRAVIMDFGLARGFEGSLFKESAETQINGLVGTPEYMAPEQISGGIPTTQTDIYALGLILFEMLRGERPFSGTSTLESWMRRARETPARLNGVVPGVERRIDSTIARCLEYDAGKRFRSVDEIWTALNRAPVLDLAGRWPVRVAAALALVAAIAGGWQLWRWQTGAAPPSAEATRWYVDAQQALAEGAAVRALGAINRSLAATPAFVLARASLAEIYLELDMPGRAQESMLLATTPSQQTATPGDAHYVSGVRQLLLHECDDAVRSLQQYAQAGLPAERPFRLLTVSRALDRCGRPEEAQKTLAQAADLDPRNAAVAVRQARLFARQREFDTALATLDKAETLFRDRNNIEGVCEALVTRGTIEAEQDSLDRATATLAKAADIAESLDDVRQRVRIRLQQAIVNRKQGDVTTANKLTADAIDIARRQNLETLTLEGLFAAGNVQVVRNHTPMRSRCSSARSESQKTRDTRSTKPAPGSRWRRSSSASWSLTRPRTRCVGPTLLRACPTNAQYRQRRRPAGPDSGDACRVPGGDSTVRSGACQLPADWRSRAGDQRPRKSRDGPGRRRTVPRSARSLRRRADGPSKRRPAAQRGLLTAEHIRHSLTAGTIWGGGSGVAPGRAGRPQRREIEAQTLVVRAAGSLRQGRYQAAWTDAATALVVGANLSSVRTARAHGIACLAGGALRRSDAASQCAAAREASPPHRHVPLWLEIRLFDAEAQLRLGSKAGVSDAIEEPLRVLEAAQASADRWRGLALAAAAREGGPRADANARLTRELENLRLLWGEALYELAPASRRRRLIDHGRKLDRRTKCRMGQLLLSR